MTESEIQNYLASWAAEIRVEKDRRRVEFLNRLDLYVVPRPKTYADRKWLEGYCEEARTVETLQIHNHTMTLGLKSLCAHYINQPTFTAIEKGRVDAFLDFIGC